MAAAMATRMARLTSSSSTSRGFYFGFGFGFGGGARAGASIAPMPRAARSVHAHALSALQVTAATAGAFSRSESTTWTLTPSAVRHAFSTAAGSSSNRGGRGGGSGGGGGGAGVDIVDPALGLTPEGAEYYSVAKAFADSELAPHAAEWDANKTFPEAALRAAAALGFGGMFVRSAYGGTGISRSDSVPIIEALASADTSTTAYLTIHNMCAGLIDTYGTEAQCEKWLPKLCTMEHFASYCLTEANAGSDAAGLQTRAKRDGEHYVYVHAASPHRGRVARVLFCSGALWAFALSNMDLISLLAAEAASWNVSLLFTRSVSWRAQTEWQQAVHQRRRPKRRLRDHGTHS